MQLDLLTPDKHIFSGEVEIGTFPGSKGSFQVLKGHAALISSLEEGKVSFRSEGQEHSYEVRGGVVEVKDDKIVVLADGLKQA